MSDEIKRLRDQLARIQTALYDTRPKQAVGEMVEHAITLADNLEAQAGEAVAFVPIHPRNGPLWANTVPQLSNDRPQHYPVRALFFHPPTGDAAGKDSVDAALYTMDQMREYADNFHLSRMKVLVAEKEAYERHAPTEPTLDQIRKIEDDFGIVWFVPDDSETFAWRTTNTDEHRKFARAVWKAAIASLTKRADQDPQ